MHDDEYYSLTERPNGISVNSYRGKVRRGSGIVQRHADDVPSGWNETFRAAIFVCVRDFVDRELTGTQLWQNVLKGDKLVRLEKALASALTDYYWPFWRDSMRTGQGKLQIPSKTVLHHATKAVKTIVSLAEAKGGAHVYQMP